MAKKEATVLYDSMRDITDEEVRDFCECSECDLPEEDSDAWYKIVNDIREIDLENDFLNVALGWFVGTENETGVEFSCFPLINWFIVPVSGYLFGSILMRIKDKKRFYLSFAPLLLVITSCTAQLLAIVFYVICIRFQKTGSAMNENSVNR